MRSRDLPSTLSLSLLFIPLLGLVLYFNWPEDKASDTSYRLDPALVPIKVAMEHLSQSLPFQQLDEEAQYEQVLAVLDKMPEEYAPLKRRYQLAMAPLPKIKFWGRVVDQHGQAVVGAYVYHSGHSAWLSSGGGAGYVKTDDEGYFKVRNRGAGLTLGQIVHPEIEYGYHWNDGEKVNLRHPLLKRQKILINREVEGHEHDTWSKYTKKSKAYEIRVWRLGQHAGAKGGGISTILPPDDSITTFRLHKPDLHERSIAGKTEGQFHLSCYHAPTTMHLSVIITKKPIGALPSPRSTAVFSPVMITT